MTDEVIQKYMEEQDGESVINKSRYQILERPLTQALLLFIIITYFLQAGLSWNARPIDVTAAIPHAQHGFIHEENCMRVTAIPLFHPSRFVALPGHGDLISDHPHISLSGEENPHCGLMDAVNPARGANATSGIQGLPPLVRSQVVSPQLHSAGGKV